MRKTVDVRIAVEVEVDETKMDEKFMEEFRSRFYEFDNHHDHMAHLAHLKARGLMPNTENPFVEGYGHLDDLGIKATVKSIDIR